jgi:hypothetical protein
MKSACLILGILALSAWAAKPPEVQVLEVKCHRTEDKVSLDGKLKVTADKPVKGLVLEFIFLSDSGDVLTTQKSEVSDETMRKNDESAFHCEGLNVPGSIRYKIRAYDSSDRELRVGNDGPFTID